MTPFIFRGLSLKVGTIFNGASSCGFESSKASRLEVADSLQEVAAALASRC